MDDIRFDVDGPSGVTSVAVHGGSDRGRAKVNACIDIPLRFDPCSGTSYSSADSF